jgi:hypothetical protein
MKQFSDRMGLTPKKLIQIESLDNDLRTGLWNAFYQTTDIFFSEISTWSDYNERFREFAYYIWTEFFKETLDSLPRQQYDLVQYLREKYFTADWYEVYNLLDHTIAFFHHAAPGVADYLAKECNRVLTRESSAYRIVDSLVSPITNEMEISELEEALKNPHQNVTTHLKNALQKLSDKVKPDYRNSVRESISAVESLCRDLTGESSLGSAIKKLKSKGMTLNSQFEQALEKLYAYTNHKETGIRHALIDSPNPPEFEEAKFMIISCSAFINYLNAKKK